MNANKNSVHGAGIAVSVGAATFITIIASAIAAILIQKGMLTENSYALQGIIINIISMLLGCVVCNQFIKDRPAMYYGVVIVCYLMTMIIGNWLLFDGFRKGWVYTVLAAVAVYLASSLILTGRKKRKGSYRR